MSPNAPTPFRPCLSHRLGVMACLLVAVPLASGATATSATMRQERRTVAIAQCRQVVVDGLGSVTVVGGHSPQVTVTATVQSFAREEGLARQQLARVRWFADAAGVETVRVGVDPRGLKPMLHAGQDGAEGIRVDLRVEVPHHAEVSVLSPLGDVAVTGVAAVDTKLTTGATSVHDIAGAAFLQTRSGRIDARGVRGKLKVETGVGGVSVRQSGGPVAIQTGGGAVQVWDCPREITVSNHQGRVDARRTGTLSVRADSSSIFAEDIGGSADLQTHNGRVSVRRLGGDYLTAKTDTGAIEVTQPTPTTTRYDLRTRNGRIDVLLSPAASVDVSLVSSLGRVQCRLPLNNLQQDTSGHQLSGSLGDGRYRLQAQSQTGTVRLLPTR
jgi:DUF4097 and DUF4098 domain-containing protein YvlB